MEGSRRGERPKSWAGWTLGGGLALVCGGGGFVGNQAVAVFV